jgi:pimeloyl-ACP methyl ester carboxylesterase
MPTMHANGIRINYADEGDGPETVLLINGLADTLETWDFQVPALLEAGYRVVRFDNRGIGATDKPAGPYSAELLADDAKAVADELGLSEYHVMGVSMGGMIAQRFALKYPEVVRTATFSSTYAAPGPFCSRMFSMWADAAPVHGVPFVMRDVTLWAFTLDFFQNREDELKEFETAMRYMDQPVHAYLAQLAVIQNHDATAELGTLKMPTLVMAGEEDILIPTALSHDLHELIPGSCWRTTPGGHGCMWEHPDEFNSAFVEFLRENERTTA